MLPLSEIASLRRTVDADWCSPVADAAAAAWGHPPGAALFWRSSACHVFVVLTRDRAAREGFLRLAPTRCTSRGRVEAVALLMARLAGRGVATVRAIPSSAGNLVETLETEVGPVHATLVAEAKGEQSEADTLTPARARAWGAALAKVHRDGTAAAEGLRIPDGLERTIHDLAQLDGDPALAEVAARVRVALGSMPRDQRCHGLVHGDFELDNLAWVGDAPIAYDWDEAERGWFAADVAHAVRDLVPRPGALLEAPAPNLVAFLAGYDDERSGVAVDRRELALFFLVNALRSLARLVPVLAEDPAAGEELVAAGSRPPRPLRSVLEELARERRRTALELAPLLA